MPRRIVDISVALKAGIVSDPPYMLPQITYLDHNAGALNFMQVFGVTRDQLPDGAGPAVEQVAAAVLAHPRAASVTVRVEKLDTGSGSVGVEIVRHRPAEAASVHQLYGEADPKASG